MSTSTTITNAVSYLTRPLINSAYSPTQLHTLQLHLNKSLSDYFFPKHSTLSPTHITLSPTRLPPQIIYSACLASGVQWFDWIPLLGGRQFDLFIIPGSVSVRFRISSNATTPWIIVWSPNEQDKPQDDGQISPISRSTSPTSSSSSFSSDSYTSATTSASRPLSNQSRRERAKHARVFVDTTKTHVTPYDGGKTTVLTGGVMLGGRSTHLPWPSSVRV
jgi:hypothetical protein